MGQAGDTGAAEQTLGGRDGGCGGGAGARRLSAEWQGGRRASLGGFWYLVGASEDLRGRFLDLWGGHFDALGTTLGDLGADFLNF